MNEQAGFVLALACLLTTFVVLVWLEHPIWAGAVLFMTLCLCFNSDKKKPDDAAERDPSP
jgi:uncharacterized membrane protein YccC